MAFAQGLKKYFSRLNGPRGQSDGLLELLLAGNNYDQYKAGLSPDCFVPESFVAEQNRWDTKFYRNGWIGGNTVDGVAEHYMVLTNSGTGTMGATQAGYEGKFLSTTGAASGNQNTWQNAFKVLPAANKILFARTQLYLPDPNVHAYDFYFGLWNTQLDPAGTEPTDGAYFKFVTAAGAITPVGRTDVNSVGTNQALDASAVIASGVPRSIELGIVVRGLTEVDFWTRDPSSASNVWKMAAATGLALRSTVALRLSFAHYTRTANTNAISVGMNKFSYEKATSL